MFSFLIKMASFKKTFMTTQNGFCQHEITKACLECGLHPTKVPCSSPKSSIVVTNGGTITLAGNEKAALI